jgi:Circularly permuted ATP-grasp type 2
MSSLFETEAARGGDRVGVVLDALAQLARRAPAGHLDSLRKGEALAPAWRTFFEKSLTSLSAGEASATLAGEPLDALLAKFEELNSSLRRKVEDNGVTYNLYSDALESEGRQSRPWSLDLLPMIMDQSEWAQIERGVAQRAELLNLMLADIYGEQRLVRGGMLPTALIHTVSSPVAARFCMSPRLTWRVAQTVIGGLCRSVRKPLPVLVTRLKTV